MVVKDPVSFAKPMAGLVSVESPPSSKPVVSKPNGERPTLPDAPTVLSAKEKVNGETKHRSNGDAKDKLNGDAKGKLNGEVKAHDPVKASHPSKSADATKESKEPTQSKASAEDKVSKAKEPEPKVDPTVDEISIPPVGDLEDEKFFAQGAVVEKEHARAAVHAEPVLDLEPDPKVIHKMRPEVRERRARFTRIVQGVVVGLMVLCLVAAYAARRSRALAASAPTKKAAPPIVAAAEPPPQPQAVAAVEPPPPEPTAAQVADPPAPAEPGAAAAQPSDKAPEAAKAEAPAAAAEPAAEPSAKTAAEEKHDAQVALERGQVKKAIEAGERSVALDETDGDAWLLLGAAYEMAGKNGEAHRCFAACLKQGKKGRLGECRAMMR